MPRLRPPPPASAAAAPARTRDPAAMAADIPRRLRAGGANPCCKPYRNASKAMLYPLLLERQG